VISFFGSLLFPLEITNGGFQILSRIFESSQPTVAIVAEQTSYSARLMVVINCQAAYCPTTRQMTVSCSTDRTFTILRLQESLELVWCTIHFPKLLFVALGIQTTPTLILAPN